jgi:hypothetical protein
MNSYLMALGCDFWLSVVNGYTAPATTPLDATAKKLELIIQGLLISKINLGQT